MLKTSPQTNTVEIRSACLWLGPKCNAGRHLLQTIRESDAHRPLHLRIYGGVNRGTASVVALAYDEAARRGQRIVCEVGTARVRDSLLALAVPEGQEDSITVIDSRPGSGGYMTIDA